MMRMETLGRGLVVLGLVLAAVGLVLWSGLRIPWLGRLPGDVLIRREGFTFYFPIATSIVISLLLTLLFNLRRR